MNTGLDGSEKNTISGGFTFSLSKTFESPSMYQLEIYSADKVISVTTSLSEDHLIATIDKMEKTLTFVISGNPIAADRDVYLVSEDKYNTYSLFVKIEGVLIGLGFASLEKIGRFLAELKSQFGREKIKEA